MKIQVGVQGWTRKRNILELDVPPELDRTINTGIRFFDQAVGGEGLTPSTCGFITGTPGAGKTTLACMLADAITTKGHIALFNIGEESLYQARKTVRRLGARRGFIAGQDRMVDDVIAHAEELRKTTRGKTGNDGQPQQVFLLQDSLQTLDDGFYKDGGITSNTAVRCMERLFAWCKKTYGIAMIVGQVTKDGKLAGKNMLKHIVDLHAHLYIDLDKRAETFGEHLLEVEKNRFGCAGRTFILGMDRRGLWEKGRLDMPSVQERIEEEEQP